MCMMHSLRLYQIVFRFVVFCVVALLCLSFRPQHHPIGFSYYDPETPEKHIFVVVVIIIVFRLRLATTTTT